MNNKWQCVTKMNEIGKVENSQSKSRKSPFDYNAVFPLISDPGCV